MNQFQWITLPLVAWMLVRSVAHSLRGERGRGTAFLAAVVWFVAGLAIWRPEITNDVAELLGIGRGADLLIYGIAFAFLLSSFYFYRKTRRLESDLTAVVRRLALDEARGLRDRGTSSPPLRPEPRDGSPAEGGGTSRNP